eukprot:UN00118
MFCNIIDYQQKNKMDKYLGETTHTSEKQHDSKIKNYEHEFCKYTYSKIVT